jgi:lipopolysaccharide cholinephosphotransferase
MGTQLTFQEFRRIQLDQLIAFDGFCKANGLHYSLDYGTLLGAVRHQGFIPWDDDTDVSMPRPDYDRFLALTKEGFGGYEVRSMEYTPGYFYPIAKMMDPRTTLIEHTIGDAHVMGVYLDIFPLDGLIEDAQKREQTYQPVQRCYRILPHTVSNVTQGSSGLHTIAKTLLYPLLHAVGPRRYLDKIDALARSVPYESADTIGCVSWDWDAQREPIAKDIYLPQTTLLFEGHAFQATAGYHTRLTSLYGDYLTPPPVEAQHASHSFTASWR